MAVFGPMAGLTGYFVLASYPAVVGGIMIFAAGGILYVIFQDIAPQVKLEKHWLPPFSAVIGFLFGLVGQMVTTS
jgi:ZIP family zinc transporter